MRNVHSDSRLRFGPIVRHATFAVGLLMVTINSPARATTVETMSVQTLADHAAQVIIGRVTAADSYWSDDHHRIETSIELSNVQYLKGRIADGAETDADAATFRLIIPGGTLGAKHMTVCCAPEPRVGQHWMFFLLETYHTFPVVGVYQGAFRIDTDLDGVERVYHEIHGQLRGVAGIDDEGFLRVGQSPAANPQDKLIGTHRMRMITTIAAENTNAPAMRLADFTAMLEPILADSRPFELTLPAGRYVEPIRTATTLRSANPNASGASPNRSPRSSGVVRETNMTTAGVANRIPAKDDQP